MRDHDPTAVAELARAFERRSAAAGRRKRDGVYQTPDWVARCLVEQTVGARLLELRRELGLVDGGASDPAALRRYAARLDGFTVVDPACGAGLLLLAAFERLLAERRWIAAQLDRRGAARPQLDVHAAARAVVEGNLFGVDLDGDAIEVCRSLLQMRAEAPAASVNLARGDALIDDEQFAWPRSFPRVFAGDDPGFDCVIGNPPYVKLQQFRRARAEFADHLIHARRSDGAPVYASTQTGNFDLYLPFIERGVGLLNRAGELGYIAPSLWLVSEYGEGLRGFVRRTRSLARWVDFAGHQVFPDATTYTALQLFSRRPQGQIRCVFAPRGPADVAALDWRSSAAILDYASLPESGAWQLLPPAQQALLAKLRARCRTLADSCEQIFVGIQTSADRIYQLRRVAPGVYMTLAKRAPERVELEDAIMRPLISGAEAKRYRAPQTDIHVLFPYALDGERPALIPASRMRDEFPRAWAYLRRHEAALRARERGKMDRDDRWWGYNYPKNLVKQRLPKLLVAETVPRLRVAYDVDGEYCLDNVRVNGIVAASPEQAWFLLAVLNGPVADHVFRATAKRKVGGYFEANKQFIAPLPIPPADAAQRRALGARARALQELHTARARAGESPELDEQIATLERELDELLYALYGLDEAEIALIEAD